MIHLSLRCRGAFVPALLLPAFIAQAARLPDSGQTTCYTDSAADFPPASTLDRLRRDNLDDGTLALRSRMVMRNDASLKWASQQGVKHRRGHLRSDDKPRKFA